jgi:ABC-2 type transport system ATP-binding protein
MAGAIVGKPKILILDEPTVGLDPKQIIEIRELIKSLGKNHTVILSSHILSEVSQICEKVIIINKGKIVAIDTPSNLEKLVANNNSIIVTVEDKEEKMINLKNKFQEISDIQLIKDNEDGTKQYAVLPSGDIDLRKKIFDILPKENITIFELKKSEASLEDAFIKLINKNTEGGKN